VPRSERTPTAGGDQKRDPSPAGGGVGEADKGSTGPRCAVPISAHTHTILQWEEENRRFSLMAHLSRSSLSDLSFISFQK